jgi:hypothetical protein
MQPMRLQYIGFIFSTQGSLPAPDSLIVKISPALPQYYSIFINARLPQPAVTSHNHSRLFVYAQPVMVWHGIVLIL